MQFLCWLLVPWGACRSARKKKPNVRGRNGGNCGFGGWPRVAYFSLFFSICVLRSIMLGDCWGQKHGFRPTLHWQGPRMVSEARNACAGIRGARKRPIPTFFPSGTCTQTPLDRTNIIFRREPNFVDAPETAQDGSFRHHFATACVFADFRPSTCRPRPKASFAREYWP